MGEVSANALPAYRSFLDAVVLPHATVFATIVVVAELLVAACMLTGIATRAAAVVAIALLANYAAAKGLAPWSPASNDSADIVLALVVLATPPAALRWPLRR